ncbi:MAG: hypothetical protein JRE29_00130 [Deltaproteobacteria bacterium]|nr:hypothetical protein [Deltaproteobacteria bacterium]
MLVSIVYISYTGVRKINSTRKSYQPRLEPCVENRPTTVPVEDGYTILDRQGQFISPDCSYSEGNQNPPLADYLTPQGHFLRSPSGILFTSSSYIDSLIII